MYSFIKVFEFILHHPQVYLHCRLVAWEPRDLDGGNKACQYDRTSSRYDYKSKASCRTYEQALSLLTDGCWLMIHPRVLSAAAVTLTAKEERKEE